MGKFDLGQILLNVGYLCRAPSIHTNQWTFFVRDKDKAHSHTHTINICGLYIKRYRDFESIWRVTFFSLELISIRQISIIIILGNIFARLIYAEGKNKLSVIYKLDISRIWRSSIYGAFVCMFLFSVWVCDWAGNVARAVAKHFWVCVYKENIVCDTLLYWQI